MAHDGSQGRLDVALLNVQWLICILIGSVIYSMVHVYIHVRSFRWAQICNTLRYRCASCHCSKTNGLCKNSHVQTVASNNLFFCLCISSAWTCFSSLHAHSCSSLILTVLSNWEFVFCIKRHSPFCHSVQWPESLLVLEPSRVEEFHMKRLGMLIVSLWDINQGFWSQIQRRVLKTKHH